jgi:hypothetical protein
MKKLKKLDMPFAANYLSWLRAPRPYGSANERRLLLDLAQFATARGYSAHWCDGNIVIRHPKKSRVLFSAHADTAHRAQHLSGDGSAQSIALTDDARIITAGGLCLGADNASGCYILARLMEARTVADFVIHTGEERGGIGSAALATSDIGSAFLAQHDYAIAFDRRGTADVITHQACGRCASDAFALTLSEELSGGALYYAPDDTGVFTDTANFTGLIPECTNVSVGYYNEHTAREWQDVEHLVALADKVLGVAWAALPVVRDPLDVEPELLELDLLDSADEWSGWYGRQRDEFSRDSRDEYAPGNTEADYRRIISSRSTSKRRH